MTTDVRTEVANPPGSSGARVERRARRIAQLYASDPQLQAAEPIPDVIDAARRPGLRLPEVIETLVGGYADRPALGQRARELGLDAAAAHFRDHQLRRPVDASARGRCGMAPR